MRSRSRGTSTQQQGQPGDRAASRTRTSQDTSARADPPARQATSQVPASAARAILAGASRMMRDDECLGVTPRGYTKEGGHSQ